MPRHDLNDWTTHLRTVAAGAAARSGSLDLDDLEAPLRRAFGLPGGEDKEARSPEARIWLARTDRSIDVDALIGPPRRGPLLTQDRYRAVEVWTDAELSAVHALWWLAEEHGRDDWRNRLEAVRTWHLEHTQPDNATNRPWALHVFLLGGTPETDHYAQTLLHNAIAATGRPTALGALILEDAACAIERISRTRCPRRPSMPDRS